LTPRLSLTQYSQEDNIIVLGWARDISTTTTSSSSNFNWLELQGDDDLLESVYKVILRVLVGPLLALIWFCRQQGNQSYTKVSPTLTHEKPKPVKPKRPYLRYTGRHGIRRKLFPRKSHGIFGSIMQVPSPRQQEQERQNSMTDNTKKIRHTRSGSSSSDDGSRSLNSETNHKQLQPAVLVYHESARSIVFRDHLRRAAKMSESNASTISETTGVTTVDTASDSITYSDALTGKLETSEVGADPAEQIRPRSIPIEGTNNIPPPVKRRYPKAYADSKNDSSNGDHYDHIDPLVGMITPITEMASDLLPFDKDTVMPSQAGIPPAQIAGFRPRIEPLPAMEFTPNDEFAALQHSPSGDLDESNFPSDWTVADRQVVMALKTERACVKTIKNSDWTAFLHRFCFAFQPKSRHSCSEHNDIAPAGPDHPFNSFVTSTTMLPECGEKMRCFGSCGMYTVGVVFELPTAFADGETEDEATKRTQTWSWPAGYSAKTEFNIDSRGKLINGREEAIRSLSVLRQYNDDYLNSDTYMISSRMVSGLSQIPYNEVFLRVGGLGRIVGGKDCATGEERNDAKGTGHSFARGVGLPAALFVRSATYGDLISLLRTRARLIHVLGEHHIRGIPLLLITPEQGVRVLTEPLQRDLWKIASRDLNPFQNPSISYKTTIDNTDDDYFEQKVEELLDLDDDIREMLTPEELARLAGGFGATDDSLAHILKNVKLHDKKINQETNGQEQSHKLQDVVNEGLASALRSGDYHTSRQLLILYSLVASREDELGEEDGYDKNNDSAATASGEQTPEGSKKALGSLGRDAEAMKRDLELATKDGTLSTSLSPPPPPPLDTDRLRGATNSDGLLAVLGAAQVLKAMQDGGAKVRVQEVVAAVEEWVESGQHSLAFRISSWYDQRAAQSDLKIATENNSSFAAFVSNKAIANRQAFAKQLREAASATDFTNMQFLMGIDEILSRMHSPCLRLELLQYVLGLDNRYSVAHLARSVELAGTCLGISTSR
jgi:hypothetical protein